MEAPPELGSAGSPREISAAERPRVRVEDGGVHESDDDSAGSDEDFEFAVPGSGPVDGDEAVTADEIFSDGLIRPAYPLFDRGLISDAGESSHRGGGGGAPARKKEEEEVHLHLRELMVEDRDAPPPPPSSSPWEAHDVEGLPEGRYCAWAPRSAPTSPDLRRKSHSAGAAEASRRWRLFDLVMGRSHSDGKERLVFVHDRSASEAAQQKKKAAAGGSTASQPEAKKKGKEKGKGGGRAVAGKPTEMDMATAHRLFYARGGATAAGDRRRSFLPYRKDLLGFIGNVNGHGSFQP